MKRSNEDINADLDRLRACLEEPHTMRQLVRLFKRDRKTVFRWLRALEARGCVVTRIGLSRPTRYAVLAAAPAPAAPRPVAVAGGAVATI